ncbi:MAG TPA: AraC family transcriptional regulator [Polyangiales bacterium]|nr:AraC family transcriptional regulator [Polyangiales bacterium]
MESLTLTAAGPSAHTLPGSQVLQLVEVLTFWDIDTAELLADTPVSIRQLEEPQARISLADFNHIVARARRLTGEPALGIFMGLRRRVTMYGFLGFAALSASSLREALELAVRFSPMICTAVKLSLHVDDGRAALRIEELCDVGDCRDVALFALLLGLGQIGKALTGCDLGGEAQLAIARPDYFDRFEDLFPRMRFDQPATQLVFPAHQLDLPLSNPDRAGLRLAREQCEQALSELRLDAGIVERVQALLANAEGSHSLDEVSTKLRMSSRTLKRRLASQGVSFSELVDRERHGRALSLVGSSSLPLLTIAERLGYSGVPNFARAFRRWTGQTPAAYRRSTAPMRARPAHVTAV